MDFMLYLDSRACVKHPLGTPKRLGRGCSHVEMADLHATTILYMGYRNIMYYGRTI
jgi:hypothetical protein